MAEGGGCRVSAPGPLVFVRYAYPPNLLGYCGPGDPDELLGAAAGTDLAGVSSLARSFEGAWPYLELIAGSNHIADPLDRRVVEAYWVGNRLLDEVPPGALIASLEDRFARRAGRDWEPLAGAVPLGGVAHHSFHVFAVYPWLGLLRAGASEAPLRVLDQCRIRWGRVEAVAGEIVTVRSRGLLFDGHRLVLGPERSEIVGGPHGGGPGAGLAPGDVVSMHWEWICDRLSPGALARLRAYTVRNLAAVNSLPRPGPVVACDRAG